MCGEAFVRTDPMFSEEVGVGEVVSGWTSCRGSLRAWDSSWALKDGQGLETTWKRSPSLPIQQKLLKDKVCISSFPLPCHSVL